MYVLFSLLERLRINADLAACACRVRLQFLRELEVPYCALYDMGYTSLGGMTDTHPNPMLLDKDSTSEDGEVRFRPAYELVEDEQERLGRDR